MTATLDPAVVWHDIECGHYRADLPLWLELADAADGPVLDIGAGTGRVALALARAGHEVVALDRQPELLQALAERAADAGLAVQTAVADAAGFRLEGRTFALVIVPMQTVQLLDGPAARAGMLASVRRHLRPGGRLAMAIVEHLEPFEADEDWLPEPDRAEHGGRMYVSQPTAVRAVPRGVLLERMRRVIDADGRRVEEHDVIELARLDAAQLADEGATAGLLAEPGRPISETDRHVGSEVVILRA